MGKSPVKFKKYIFGLSKLMEAGNQLDTTMPLTTVEAKDVRKAVRKLDPPPLGRIWIYIREEV